jgi:hypothetical protein
MQYTALLVLVAAAAVSADYAKIEANTPYQSTTYGKVAPPHQHYDCDATHGNCYAPKSYGNDYKPEGYTYEVAFPYPGPKERFCKKLKKIGAAIKKFFKKIFLGFKHTWVHFKSKWHTWCATKQSDALRFKHWLSCEKKEFKDWWEYHHDLCRTRKALWDDAMREFHRQWCHYKETHKATYEKRKEACSVKHRDYDDTSHYRKKINHYGVTPIEDQYKGYSKGYKGKKNTYKYEPKEYKDTCKKRDDAYKGKHQNLGYSPSQTGPVAPVPGTGTPIPEPVGGDEQPPTPVGGEAVKKPVSG